MAALDRLLRWLGLDFDLELGDDPAFHRIRPRLSVGPRPRPDDVDTLRDAGITHTVSCLPATERDATAFLADTFRAHFVPVRDGIDEDLTAALTTFFGIMAQLAPDEHVLVHCEVGVSRSATLAIAHVMRSESRRFYEAFVSVRERRPQILPNIGFASRLQRLEHELHPRRPVGEPASLTRYLHEVCRVPVEMDLLQATLEQHEFDAVRAVRAIFGGDIPRVVQGVRSG